MIKCICGIKEPLHTNVCSKCEYQNNSKKNFIRHDKLCCGNTQKRLITELKNFVTLYSVRLVINKAGNSTIC